MHPEEVQSKLEVLIQDIADLGRHEEGLAPEHLDGAIHDIVGWFIQLIREVDR